MRPVSTLLAAGGFAAGGLFSGSALGQGSFVNWESPHVHPIDVTPDGARVLVVNTADNRLEVFETTDAGLALSASIPVGLDPVSVRARTNDEVWVVNHISDSISIVDLDAGNVTATLYPGDEPADVVFAGPNWAFVSVSQLNLVRVYNALNPLALPATLPIAGEDPRALATDGTNVYVAIFESGNRTTVLAEGIVSSGLNPYPGDPNPPPNSGAGFNPPIAAGLPAAPGASLVVRKDDAGAWRDVNGVDWSGAVGWDLHDHDVAVINAQSLAVGYVTGLMNVNMALAARPGGGVSVVGTDAINDVRFEPNLNGIFVRVIGANVPAGGGTPSIVDLNPHLTYASSTVPQALRDESIGDPRAIAWRAAGDRAFIAGMGSNNVAIVDAALGRLDLVEVGAGPTGIALDENRQRVYVVNRFEGSVSILETAEAVEIARVHFYDPTPEVIRAGRPFLYDTHATSGLGQASCASCHIDGRMDQLAWDLGNPVGEVKPFNQICNFGLGGCEDWHPMKGPMTTQTLVGITGTEPLHWRGDREDLPAFNGAFEVLLGDDEQLSPVEVDQFLAFVSTLRSPPNPFRLVNGDLPFALPNGGLPWIGEFLFEDVALDLFVFSCQDCHAHPTGTNGTLTSGSLLGETQSFKVPQLRNLYEKTGFDATSASNNRGFGFIHDGSIDSVFNFLQAPVFVFADDQQRRDVEAFLMCFTEETHAAVGVQATLPVQGVPGQRASLADMMGIAAEAGLGVVAKGTVGGEQRGYYLALPGVFQSDRVAENHSVTELAQLAVPGAEITFTLVPAVIAMRVGVDRDEDGYFDRDEIDAGSNPADPASTPANVVVGDLDGDGIVGIQDFLALLAAWGACGPGACPADLNGDGIVGIADLLLLLINWS